MSRSPRGSGESDDPPKTDLRWKWGRPRGAKGKRRWYLDGLPEPPKEPKVPPSMRVTIERPVIETAGKDRRSAYNLAAMREDRDVESLLAAFEDQGDIHKPLIEAVLSRFKR